MDINVMREKQAKCLNFCLFISLHNCKRELLSKYTISCGQIVGHFNLLIKKAVRHYTIPSMFFNLLIKKAVRHYTIPSIFTIIYGKVNFYKN